MVRQIRRICVLSSDNVVYENLAELAILAVAVGGGGRNVTFFAGGSVGWRAGLSPG